MLKSIIIFLFGERCDQCGKKTLDLYPANMFSETLDWNVKICKKCFDE